MREASESEPQALCRSPRPAAPDGCNNAICAATERNDKVRSFKAKLSNIAILLLN
ncbi:hypothetical protein [Xanthomonas vesicatoria]|uniref:Uncharacterized protein n=1 Tax=Xanthomonas vesicatoria TaxID=56460 RepID=A0ABS8LG71_9XANT|nr:hypothetical protein [Xanthomonas vesicatoria]MCC8618037.1 hypothetical protein [Xanthomonas vesicatoria]MCC8624140.1 hypothetical protein [Xanthomonas vesicatoria]MCC8631723.1 hypothetical protein [Xanthomonas vesicatoria]MCC8695939.1 hypothetical protein [Xanthomonas vesicatoria]MCC8701674.1 hypothetical protein [Xanthomonas vesicatoria]